MAHDESVATQKTGNTASSPKVVICDIVAVFCFPTIWFSSSDYLSQVKLNLFSNLEVDSSIQLDIS